MFHFDTVVIYNIFAETIINNNEKKNQIMKQFKTCHNYLYWVFFTQMYETSKFNKETIPLTMCFKGNVLSITLKAALFYMVLHKKLSS